MGVSRDPDPGRVDLGDTVSARDVLESAPDALVIVDESGRIVQINGLTEQLFGYSREEIVGRPVEDLVPARYHDAHVAHRSDYLRDPKRRPMGGGPELYGVRKDGTEFPVDVSLSPLRTHQGTVVMAAIRDISARREAEAERDRLIRERALLEEISRLSQHDPLTGLPSRTLLANRLVAAISAAQRHGHRAAVILLELDRFKQVNDALGHGTGDALLRLVGKRLSEVVREIDLVARQGGDEFIVLLPEVERRDQVADMAGRMLAAIGGPHTIGSHELQVTGSIGIAIYPDDGADAETLIKHADVAMYAMKDRGRDGYQFFDRAMNARIAERQALEGRLRGALGRREFVLHYQPKIDLETGAMVGAEALVRWQQPDGVLVPPALFVPIAEETGLIVSIGRWVLREACRQAREWQLAGFAPLTVAVNISALEFRHPDFLPQVGAILRETGLEARWLELELTESVLMESVVSTANVLRELKALGVGLAVDDFGTGYSSLSYLMEFPIDTLKVDQSFVREITGASSDSPIITAVISMGRSLNQRVVAEGIETAAQLAFLQKQRCCEGQGFHFSPPLAARRFETLMARV